MVARLASQNDPTWRKHYSCNHCIQYLKRKVILMYHKISLHEENSNLAITAYNTSKENSFWFILYLPPPNLLRFVSTCGKQCSCNHWIQYFERKFVLILHIKKQYPLQTILKKLFFWCITHLLVYSNIQKIVFLQSLHTILQKKIRFDASGKLPT